MRGKNFTQEQIIKALKSHEAGVKVSEICRDLGIVEQTFYRWRTKVWRNGSIGGEASAGAGSMR